MSTDGSVYNPATGCCLADPDASTANSMRLIDGTCNGTASQQWTIPTPGPPTALRRRFAASASGDHAYVTQISRVRGSLHAYAD